MTAQINDRVFHRKVRYSIAGVSGRGLFHPASYGIEPEMLSSACWRGFHADYEIRDSKLLMTSLTIGLAPEHALLASRGELPFAPGVVPVKDQFGQPTIEGLSLAIPYTGGLLLAHGFIRDLYVHMGFHPAWKYTDVRELIFEQGQVTEDHDRSQQMAELRERLAGQPLQPGTADRAVLLAWIERCFSQDYSR